MINTIATWPKWALICLYPFAWILIQFRRGIFFVKYNYIRLRNRLYIYIHKRQAEKRNKLIKEIQKLVLIYIESGGNSKYIPKDIKSHADMRNHILNHYGANLKKHKLIITPKLKIKRV